MRRASPITLAGLLLAGGRVRLAGPGAGSGRERRHASRGWWCGSSTATPSSPARAASRVRVRLLGVDAPESVTPDQPVGCFGPEAGDAARRLLPRAPGSRLETDPTQGREDRFGRRLAVVTVAGQATSVNEQLVAGGYARVFRGDGRARLLPALGEAQREARRGDRGLWAACPLAARGY